LQRYDLERDEALRKWNAACWGAEIKNEPVKPSNGRPAKQTMTAWDIMRNHKKANG